MARIAYVNGAYVPMDMAFVHVEDRGFQFADGVYEGIVVKNGRMIDLEPHLDRLERSLNELQIAMPMARGPLKLVFSETIRRNKLSDAFLYVQITRGVAKRDHAFPHNCPPTLVVTVRRLNLEAIRARAEKGVKAVSQPDIRWGRCDVKSIGLLPNVLAKQAAKKEGSFEAVLVDKAGYVTEGSSTNIWIVTEADILVTRATNANILPGITRQTITKLAQELQIKIEERAFTLDEAKSAKEMFLTSSTSCATPIINLDGQKIGDGIPGRAASKLLESYCAYMDQ